MNCCNKPSIATMDYKWPIFANPEEQVQKINRVCVKCFAHWFGVERSVMQYSKIEWDALINESRRDAA